MRKPFVEIIISTLNQGLFDIKICSSFDYLIIHQVTDNDSDAYDDYIKNNFYDKIRYIRSFSTGLSKSRNIGIKNSIGTYLWIMDDDTSIIPDIKDKIINMIQSQSADLYVLKHTSNSKNIIPSTNEKIKCLNILSATSVSSIDMLIKASSLDNLCFDEGFGLGTKYPSGEEYIFCCDLLRSNKKIITTNITASVHPDISSGHDFFSTPLKLVAKRKMFIRATGKIKGSILFYLFIIKNMPTILKNRAFTNLIKSLSL